MGNVNTNYDKLTYKNVNDKKTIADSSKSNKLGKQEFLNLLTTQLKYQDPLNPMQDKDSIAQMAQFSALEQMQNLNKTLETGQKGLLDAIKSLNNNNVTGSKNLESQIDDLLKEIKILTHHETDIINSNVGVLNKSTITDIPNGATVKDIINGLTMVDSSTAKVVDSKGYSVSTDAKLESGMKIVVSNANINKEYTLSVNTDKTAQ